VHKSGERENKKIKKLVKKEFFFLVHFFAGVEE
jgi:hypothetical protein